MKLHLLAPVGRAEPDDVKAWFSHGGFVGVQAAWALPIAEVRRRLAPVQRRYGAGTIGEITDQPVSVEIAVPAAARMLAEETPAYMIEAALVWARACGQSNVTLCVAARDGEILHLLQEVGRRMTQYGIVGADGFTRTEVAIVAAQEPNPHALDAVTARLLPIVLWEGAEPPVTLVMVEGNIASPGVYEIPIGTPLRDLLFNWAGGLKGSPTVSLGGRMLDKAEWAIPLTPATLGNGRILCE